MYANDGWNALYIENHDQGRSISRYASQKPEFRTVAGKMLATFLGLQSGTPFIYQGQEIGMVNVPDSWGIQDFRDIETLNCWNELIKAHPDDQELQKQTLIELRLKSRDNGRTPMQWNAEPHAGFTSPSASPWIKVHDDYAIWNTVTQTSDPDSVYWYWNKVLGLRKQYLDVFVYGDYKLVDAENESVFAYTRSFGSITALVVTSFSENSVRWSVPAGVSRGNNIVEKIVLGNYPSPKIEDASDGKPITLNAFEAFVAILA